MSSAAPSFMGTSNPVFQETGVTLTSMSQVKVRYMAAFHSVRRPGLGWNFARATGGTVLDSDDCGYDAPAAGR
jgi:hypothetical protein